MTEISLRAALALGAGALTAARAAGGAGDSDHGAGLAGQRQSEFLSGVREVAEGSVTQGNWSRTSLCASLKLALFIVGSSARAALRISSRSFGMMTPLASKCWVNCRSMDNAAMPSGELTFPFVANLMVPSNG
jgi:hypothetical protein